MHETSSHVPTAAELASLPPMPDVPTTAWLLGISRTSAYQLAAADALPVPVIRIGRSLRIPTAPLLALLGHAPATDGPREADRAAAGESSLPGLGTEQPDGA